MFSSCPQYVPLKELCGSMSGGRLTVLLPLLRYRDAVLLCKGLRGYIDAPTTMEEVMQTLAYFKDMVEGATLGYGNERQRKVKGRGGRSAREEKSSREREGVRGRGKPEDVEGKGIRE